MPKSFYKYDRADAQRRSQRDPERENASARAYGILTWKEFHLIPLSDIQPQKVWNLSRIEKIREGIRRGVALPAISLTQTERGRYKYEITDGIHRYNASIEAGYTHVPAIVEYVKETPELKEAPKTFREGTYVRFWEPFDGRWEYAYLAERVFGQVFVTLAGDEEGSDWLGDLSSDYFSHEVDPPPRVKSQIQGHWYMQKTSRIKRADTYLSTYLNRIKDWEDLVAPFFQAEKGSPEDRYAITGGFNAQFFFLTLLREKQAGGRKIEDMLPTEAEGSLYVNMTGGPALNREMFKLAMKMEQPAVQLLKSSGPDREFERAYKKFMRGLRAYTERAKSLVNTASSETLYEKFTWKGIRFEVQGFTEDEVRIVLDNLSWVLDLFKRRGMDKAVPQALRTVLLTDETHTFVTDRTRVKMVGHGLYEAEKKRITLRKVALAKSSGKMLKRWLAEIFLHEFGHHVHLSILPREAREFWDSGWEKVEEAMKAKEDAKKITKEDRDRFIKLIQDANYDFQGVGRNLEGLDRLKYVAYLNLRGIINGTKYVRLNDEGKRLQQIGRDPESYVLDRGGMGLFTEEELAEVVPKEIERMMRHLERRLGVRLTAPEPIPQKIVDRMALDDKDIERALTALGIPTEYGSTNVREDFAETFVQFMVAPEKLDPVARWRMGRTLGMSASLGTPIIKLTKNKWYLRQATEDNFWLSIGITNPEEAEGYLWEVDEWLTIFQRETSAFTTVNSPFDYDHNPDLELAERPKAFFDRFVTFQIYDSQEYAYNALDEINEHGDFDVLMGLLSDVVNTLDGAYGWAEQVLDTLSLYYPEDFAEKKRLLESSYATLLEDIKTADDEIKRVLLMLHNDLKGLDAALNPPLHETFTWKGIRIVNNGFPEKTVYAFLDHMSWLMDLFKRRGLDALILDSVSEVILSPEDGTFINEKTHETQTAVGDYNPNTKTIRFLPGSLDPDNIGPFLKRWTAEVFLHELGHHIHLNLLPKEAKAFWDSGWAIVDKQRKILDDMRYITPEESEDYAKEIERANFDVNAVGRKKKGLERLKFLCYLNALGLIKTPKYIRIDSKIKKEISRYLSFSKDKDKFIDHLRAIGPYYENMRPDAIERVADYELGVLRDNLVSRFKTIRRKEVPLEVLEQIRAQDTSVDQALDALGIPSDYGKTNVEEDFAETFVEFLVHPERLSKVARWRMGRTLGMSASLGTPIMKLTKRQKIASRVSNRILKTSKNLPKKVEEYAKKFQDEGKDEGYAWALAWSIYCKHVNPESPHCKADSYLDNQGKTSSNNPYQIIFEEPYDIDIQNPYDLARDCGIYVSSNKSFYAGIVEGEPLQETLVGAVFTSNNSNESYSFDVVVHPSHRRKGYGRLLTEMALENYEDLREIFPDMELHVEAINPIMAKILKRQGLTVKRRLRDRVILGAFRLSKQDKSVIESFLAKAPDENGKLLGTDGRVLEKFGMGNERVARWRGKHIAILSSESAKSDEVILGYLEREAKRMRIPVHYEEQRGDKAPTLRFEHGGDMIDRYQFNNWIKAYVPGRKNPVGWVQYSVFRDVRNYNKLVHTVQFVEVAPEYRQQGIATALYKEILKHEKIPLSKLRSSLRTDLGQKFRERMRMSKKVARKIYKELHK